MKNIFALFLMAGVCFGQSQPAIYLTQPYIGNGLSQAQNNFQAQTNIGINPAGVSNVVLNAVTNGDIRPIGLLNNLTVESQQGNGDGGAIWLNANTDGSGAMNGGEIDISANADDINTVMGKIVISSTNANPSSGSLGEIDIYAGEIVDIYGGGAGINLNTPLGATAANGAGITNVPTFGLTGQILLSSLTNAGTLWTNGAKFAFTNGGLQFTNFAIFQTTNSGARITNFINAQLAAIQTNLTAANVNTNLNINGRSQEGQDVSKISILNSSNAVNLVYSRVPSTLTWTNSGSGFGIFSNTSGGFLQFNLIDSVGNIWFFKTNSPQGQWSVNFVATNAPTGDWGRISDFAMGQNAEAFTLTNIPVSAITGVFPIGDLPTNTMTVYAATNAYLATNGATSGGNILITNNSYIPISFFGTLGGTNDDTVAFQAAANSGSAIWVDPKTNYTIGNVWLTNNTSFIGSGTRLIFKTNSTGYMFNMVAASTNINMHGLVLDGTGFVGSGTMWFLSASSNITSTAGLKRSAIHIYGTGTNIDISGLYIKGFSTIGILAEGSLGTFPQPTVASSLINDCVVENCFKGIVFTNSCEYINPQGLQIKNCGYGLDIISGNVHIFGANITRGGIGVNVSGVGGVSNPAHGSINGVFNHNDIDVSLDNINNGELFSGCTFLGGGHDGIGNWVYSTNCLGITFVGCQLSSGLNMILDKSTNAIFGSFGGGIPILYSANSSQLLSGGIYDYNSANLALTNTSPNNYFTGLINAANGISTTSNSVAAVTVGSSAFLFTNTTPSNLRCFVSGGAATTSVGLNGTTVAASVAGLDYFIVIAPNEYITLTYSVGTPTLNTNRF